MDMSWNVAWGEQWTTVPETKPIETTNTVSAETRALLRFGRHNGWKVKHVGFAPYPTQPIKLDEWLLIPAHMDTSEIPLRTIRRVRRLEEAGFNPVGYALAHEVVRAETVRRPRQVVSAEWVGDVQALIRAGGGVLRILGTVLVVLAGAVVMVGGVLLSIAAAAGSGLLAGLASIDPIYLIFMPDRSVVELDRWWSK